jgi:hypothetical protein
LLSLILYDPKEFVKFVWEDNQKILIELYQNIKSTKYHYQQFRRLEGTGKHKALSRQIVPIGHLF